MASQNWRFHTMATTTAHPTTTPTTVRVEVERELSGPQWCARFPRSSSIADLRPSFQLPVNDFVWAMEQAGASVVINNTFRPLESCYLMHYAWLIHQQLIDSAKVPDKDGVLIRWEHPTKEASLKAAQAMCERYAILRLKTKPALDSRHSHGEAIDMSISWSGELDIKNKQGEKIKIASTPKNGMNPDLKEVGASYGVIKYFRGYDDVPHWSTDGH